ncbi:AraC family transcriptional regulator [Natranaerovirga pectinivora]|uniref:AraC family transcriptional regulator n=1 Tax=Natranaerovirga pectinivora TaxID=682400 RepID=A0A4R3MPW7_9FIRM|nr:AraC family transcriptional regulator [Natranaerovirga pectinivora]TCT15669.1 AraC family transcriptional regulator [Natranaerovirga pectinivora]
MGDSFQSPGKKYVISTMERFHLCTHIPIKAVDKECTVIHTEGHSDVYESIFREHKVLDRIDNEMDKEDINTCLILSNKHIEFTVIYLCPKNFDRGFYILGPYTTNPLTNNLVLYKPSNCIPHLITLLRNLARDSDFIRKKREPNYSIYVRKALEYISTKYNEPLTVEEISDYLGISKCYFCSLFKKDTKKTFTQALNEIRIEKSKELLKDTDLSLLDIAIAVGFNNQNYYNMIFKKMNDITPYQYRNMDF